MNAISGDCFANAAIRSCFVDTVVEFRCIRRVSQERFLDPTPRFPPLAPGGTRSPASSVLSRRYDFPPSIPPHFVAFVWRYLSRSLAHFAPRRTSAPPRPGVGNPVSPAGTSPRKRQDLPSSWRTPIVRLHMFHTDAGRTADTRPLRCCGMALGPRMAKAPAKGLSTLNSMAFGLAVYASQCGLPRPTQNSLPAAGQALPDGLSTRKVPMKGFRSVSYISSSLPKFPWRNR